MRKHIINLSLAALTLIVGGCATAQRTPEHIILKTLGSAGQGFAALLTVDGVRREISGVTPAEFPLECVVLVGEVTKVDGDGSFSFVIERQNGRGLFYTPPLQSFSRFRYYSGSMSVLAQN